MSFSRAGQAQAEIGREGTNRRPKVILYTDSSEPSGVGEHMMQLAREMQIAADLVFALSHAGTAPALGQRARGEGFEVRIVPHDSRFEEAFARLLTGERPEILHVHAGIGWEGWQAPPLARRLGVPVLIRTEHLPWLLDRPEEQTRYREGLQAFDAVICVSESARQSYLRAGIPPGLLHVVRNGIRSAPLRQGRLATRESLGLDLGSIALLTVARFTEQKGHRLLLDAVPDIVRAFPEACFLWAGVGPLEGELGARIAAERLDRHVRLLGHRDDVPDLLAASDIYVLPSLFEGLPLSLLEAHFAHLPVVATRSPGTNEVEIDGVTALLVEAGNARELGEAVCRVLGDPALAARIAGAGARHVVSHFTATRMARETHAIYRQCLEARTPETGARAAE